MEAGGNGAGCKNFPTASQYDLQRARIQVAQALAGNTRAMLQVGRVDDIAQTLILRDALQDRESASAGGGNDASQNTGEGGK